MNCCKKRQRLGCFTDCWWSVRDFIPTAQASLNTLTKTYYYYYMIWLYYYILLLNYYLKEKNEDHPNQSQKPSSSQLSFWKKTFVNTQPEFYCLHWDTLYFQLCLLISKILSVSIEQHTLKNENNCFNINIYSYLETSGIQNYNLYINVVHFSTPLLIRYLWHLKTVVFLHWCLICVVPLN